MFSLKKRLASTTGLSLCVGLGLALAACSMLGMEDGSPGEMAEAPAGQAAETGVADTAGPGMTAQPESEPAPDMPAEGAPPAMPELAEGPVSEACAVPRLEMMAAQSASEPAAPAAADGDTGGDMAAAMVEPVEMTDMEAINLYNCLAPERSAAYALSGNPIAMSYSDWPRFSIRAYRSESHGGRFVQNYAKGEARAYGKWENAGTMPAGTQLVKDSFNLHPDGKASIGPLFLMEKMEAGFNPDSDDWKYTLILPDGTTVGTTNGEGSSKVEFCYECHKALSTTDSMLLVPPDLRGG